MYTTKPWGEEDPTTTHAIGEEDPDTTHALGEEDDWPYPDSSSSAFGSF
ncbi:MAG TPA: hypothetical protein VF584_17865 [Longimicrobium sp.]|jgi:hypothetical protein